MKLRFYVALACVSASVSANAQSVDSDVKCLIVSSVLSSQAQNEQTRMLTAMTSAFYLGRVDGRVAPSELRIALQNQRQKLSGSAAVAVLKICAAQAEAANSKFKAAAKQASGGK